MIVSSACLRVLSRALAGVAALLACGAMLSGCADMSDGMASAFADPSKYNLYNCKQLEAERKSQAIKMAELQGLMNKAQSGFAGPVVAEVAYRNDYIALRGQKKNADEAWVLNKCRETPPSKTVETPAPAPAPATTSGHGPTRSGSAVY
ncbi:twin-arginine translocation pathway signal [Bradyrhizobium sp.]|uniref:twin-arginine translocation pathway signal n=1 Tax=Bradyrhizobium sp. TaxID=376 RepID=UPI003C5ECD9A